MHLHFHAKGSTADPLRRPLSYPLRCPPRRPLRYPLRRRLSGSLKMWVCLVTESDLQCFEACFRGIFDVVRKDTITPHTVIWKCLAYAAPPFKMPLHMLPPSPESPPSGPTLRKVGACILINSVQTRCIVKGEAQKSPLFWRFSGGFCFSQDRLFSRNSTREPLNLIKSPIFTNAPCKTACLYNAPSMRTLDLMGCLSASALESLVIAFSETLSQLLGAISEGDFWTSA